MEDIAKLVDRILVMHKGRIAMDDTTIEVFKRADELKSMGLGVPQITDFMKQYYLKGNDIKQTVLTVEEGRDEILRYLRSKSDA